MVVNVQPINVVTFLIGIVFVLNGYRLVRQGKEDLPLLLVSVVLGAGLLVVAVFPNVFGTVSTLLGLEWKARAILVVSNLTLFCVCYYLVTELVAVRNRVSKLNEELSLLRRRFEDEE